MNFPPAFIQNAHLALCLQPPTTDQKEFWSFFRIKGVLSGCTQGLSGGITEVSWPFVTSQKFKDWQLFISGRFANRLRTHERNSLNGES